MSWLRFAGAVATAGFLVLLLHPVPGLAQNDRPVSQPVTFSAGAVRAYWTAERMRAARPMPLPNVPGRAQPAASSPAPGAAAGPTVVANSGGAGDPTLEEVRYSPAPTSSEVEPLFGTAPFTYTRHRLFPDLISTYRTFPYRAIGKLFFTIPGSGDFVCSAASVNSTNRSVAWTAGHCVFSPGVGFHTNFLFSPGRRVGSNPFGTWTAKQAFTLTGWQSGLLEYDHGALAMNLGGTTNDRIGNAVGFLGFLANAQRKQHWHLHGYPAGARDLTTTPPGAQFDGEHHEICAAAWANEDLPSGNTGNPKTVGVGCDATGGTSGGPWVVDFSGVNDGATNLLNGNNSYRKTGPNPPENLKLYSPYFTNGAINLRSAAQAVAIP